jgi:hypothetical protein
MVINRIGHKIHGELFRNQVTGSRPQRRDKPLNGQEIHPTHSQFWVTRQWVQNKLWICSCFNASENADNISQFILNLLSCDSNLRMHGWIFPVLEDDVSELSIIEPSKGLFERHLGQMRVLAKFCRLIIIQYWITRVLWESGWAPTLLRWVISFGSCSV